MKDGVCIVIGAGDLTVGSIPYNPEKDFVIAADGGLMYCSVLELEPDLIIGDFDSVDEAHIAAVEAIRQARPEKVKLLPAEKDDTDMLAAIKEGLALGYRKFYLYGACGGRLEHTIANIQLLKYLKLHEAVGYIMEGTGMTLLATNETISFKPGMEGYLNVFCMGDKAKGVTLSGLKYPLQNAELTNDFPIGISNEFTEKSASVTVEEGTLLLIISWVC